MSSLHKFLLFLAVVFLGLGLSLALARLLEGCTESRLLFAQKQHPNCEILTLHDGALLARCPFRSDVIVGGSEWISEN